MDTAPKLFISYSWSSPEHERWVIALSTQLTESGVDVILDKWELKEGHDTISFMERMVNDPAIQKVAIISDENYATKANSRQGGVGTETQIISAEVYAKAGQGKFVAVLPSLNGQGKPFVPTYYKGRIYIDLSGERYAEEFDRLLRWVFDKPLHVKPAIGKRPAYLEDEQASSLGTAPLNRRLLDALRNGKSFSHGALTDYLETFATGLGAFRVSAEANQSDVTSSPDKHLDEVVVETITQFTPFRDEFVQTLLVLSQYGTTNDFAPRLHRFFETLLGYLNPGQHTTEWQESDFDSHRFIVHELFLYTIAVLIRDERFEAAEVLLTTPYYVESVNAAPRADGYSSLNKDVRSFTARGRRLRRISARADLLKSRADSSPIDFKQIMQADFILYLRSALPTALGYQWLPETGIFATRMYGPFEVFARSESLSYLDRFKIVLGIQSREELSPIIEASKTREARVPQWEFERLEPAVLIGWEKLGKRR